jgi:hypothetical protein
MGDCFTGVFTKYQQENIQNEGLTPSKNIKKRPLIFLSGACFLFRVTPELKQKGLICSVFYTIPGKCQERLAPDIASQAQI